MSKRRRSPAPEPVPDEDWQVNLAEADAAENRPSASGPRAGARDFKTIMAALAADALDIGLCAAARAEPETETAESLLRRLADHRPPVLLTAPYPEFIDEVAEALAARCGLKIVHRRAENGKPLSTCLRPIEKDFLVALRLPVAGRWDGSETLNFAPFDRSEAMLLVLAEAEGDVPAALRGFCRHHIRIEPFDAAGLSRAIAVATGSEVLRKAPTGDVLASATPQAIARLAATGLGQLAVYGELRLEQRRRAAAAKKPHEGPGLDDLRGYGAALTQVRDMVADLKDAMAGKAPFEAVDRGILLTGPPGTGKTQLAQAMSRSCGVPFLLCSAAEWQHVDHLGEHVGKIRTAFRQARAQAPCFMFIDEVDAIGSRDGTERRNSHYQNVVINTVLEELQGFNARGNVFLIAATNRPHAVDPALRRAGRLDRVVEVGLPDVTGLAEIFRYHLNLRQAQGQAVEDIDLKPIGRLALGRTGADVEAFVRGAWRRARRGARAITAQDLRAEVLAAPAGQAAVRFSEEDVRRVAVHEAGHALTALSGGKAGPGVELISIVPRANGAMGLVARLAPPAAALTQADIEEEIRVLLGGRAAEELVYGRHQVSAGAGDGPASDLAHATRLAFRMLGQLGFSDTIGLLWVDWRLDRPEALSEAEAARNNAVSPALFEEARALMARLYADTVQRLRHRRADLDAIVAALLDRGELTGEELTALLTRPTPPGPTTSVH